MTKLAIWPIFWIIGIALAGVGICYHVAGPQTEAFEFKIHTIAGTLLPVLILGLAYLFERRNILSFALTSALSLVFVGVAATHIRQFDWPLLVISLIQFLFFLRQPWTTLEKFSALVLSIIGWGFARWLMYFSSSWIPAYFLPFFVFILGFVVLNLGFFFPEHALKLTSKIKINPKFFDAAFIYLLVMASFKVGFDFHHGSYYVGPTELVRQGGTLLWDVPSQYGFLNVLLMALLPTSSAWQSLYVVNSFSILACALTFFFVARKVAPGLIGSLIGFLVTFSTVHMLPGLIVGFNGANAYPSSGGLRFVFCYVLLFLVYQIEEKKSHKLIWAGNSIWLLSVFWSFESAVYGTAIWFSFLGLRSLPDVKKTVLNIAQPLVLLAVAATGLVVFYHACFGHGPDFKAYIEYALAYKNGFYSELVNPKGSVWVMLLLFAALLTLLIESFKIQRRGTITTVSAFFCFWAVSSYFVSRSHENNVLNLMPLLIYTTAVSFMAVRPSLKEGRAAFFVTALVWIPIFLVSFTVTYGNRFLFPGHLKAVLKTPIDRGVDSYVPEVIPEINELLLRAKVQATDPLIYSDRTLIGKLNINGISVNPKLWLPLAPEWQLCILPAERQREYIKRFLEQKYEGGWILMRKAEVREDHCMRDKKIIKEFFNSSEHFESENWELEKFSVFSKL